MGHLRKTFNLPVMLIIVLGIASLCLMRTYAKNAKGDKPTMAAPRTELRSPTSSSPAMLPTVQADDDDKGFWLTIRPTGFEVKEMTIPAGDYFVVVQNATGLNRFSLRVEREAGVRIYDLRFPKYQKYWKQMVRLVPGHYVISEPDHADWVCQVTVN